jgi:hypothetical protein
MTISGHFIYNNLAISQHQNIIEPFSNMISKIKPERVLEIGTSQGGLTLMIRDILDQYGLYQTDLTTYDVYDPVYLKNSISTENKNITIKVETLFCQKYVFFKNEETKNLLKNYIQEQGTTLILCDGGNKSAEFNLFAELIKKEDIIMAHDYAPNKEYFEQHMRDKIWNWHEIQDSDIQESCQKYQLIPYMQNEFLSVAWGCFIKQDT